MGHFSLSDLFEQRCDGREPLVGHLGGTSFGLVDKDDGLIDGNEISGDLLQTEVQVRDARVFRRENKDLLPALPAAWHIRRWISNGRWCPPVILVRITFCENWLSF